MVIKVSWEDIEFLTVERKEGLYFSTIDIDKVLEVHKKGFPKFFIEHIPLVSEELPILIAKRVKNQDKRLKFKDDFTDEEKAEDLINYINMSELREPKDKISVTVIVG